MAANPQNETINANSAACQQRGIGNHLVCPDRKAQTGKQDKHRPTTSPFAIELTGSHCDSVTGKTNKQARCQTCRIGLTQGRAEQPEEERGHNKVERRLFHKRFAGQGWHNPVPTLGNVANQPKGIGFVRLPRFMAHQPRQQPAGENNQAQ